MADIVFAYDGSPHGGWVGRYAIHLAGHTGGRLLVLHVDETADDSDRLDAGVDLLLDLAGRAGVDASSIQVPRSDDVADSITAFMLQHPGALLVLGLRARADGRGLLTSTVAEWLLLHAPHDVLAIRVASPDQLGSPKHILYALSQNPDAARNGREILERFGPERVSVFTVVQPADDERAQSAAGARFLADVEFQLRGPLGEIPIDTTVRVAAEWTGEVLRHAAEVDAELLLVGATERSLPRRIVFGLERVLHEATRDVAIFRLGSGRPR